jgi:hypothetical protein
MVSYKITDLPNNVKVVFLPTNKTYCQQLLHQAVTATFKVYYLVHTSVKLTDAPNDDKPSISDFSEAFSVMHITDITVQT